MKNLCIAVLLCAASALAQTTHSATLTWTEVSPNPTGTTYTVWRAPGLCSGSPVFAKIATAIAAKTYVDTSVTVGGYCFAVTATFNGAESPQSNTKPAQILPFAPSELNVQVQ
jgi:hypothetical protein